MDSGSSCVHAPARVTLRIAALLAGLLLLPVTAHAESQEAQTHVVYSGQRLGSIAKRYGVSVEALCTANDLRPTAPLKPGQRLVIPARGDRDGSRARIAAGHESTRHRSATERPAPNPTHRVEPGQRLESIARRYGVKLVKNPFFILNTLTLMRGAIGYQVREPERFLRYVDAMFRAIWVDGRNLGDAGVVAQTLREAGFDAEAFTQMTADVEVKQKLIRATEEAVKRGVFGAPTMFVGSEMFFGQDRLEFVKEALRT